jgi:hypothetical protein
VNRKAMARTKKPRGQTLAACGLVTVSSGPGGTQTHGQGIMSSLLWSLSYRPLCRTILAKIFGAALSQEQPKQKSLVFG